MSLSLTMLVLASAVAVPDVHRQQTLFRFAEAAAEPLPTPSPTTDLPEDPPAETVDTPAPPTSAPDTSAPNTPAPDTPAPVTPVPDTSAPNTPAPDTPAPVTPVPDTAAPPTPGPTVAPVTMGPAVDPSIKWCVADSDCAKYGDNGATCTSGRCSCSAGFSNPQQLTPSVTAYTCANSNKMTREVVHAAFDAVCDKFTDEIADLFSVVMVKVLSGKIISIKKVCAETSLVLLVSMEEVPVDHALTTDLLTGLTAEFGAEGSAALLAALGVPRSAGGSSLDMFRCDVSNATIVLKMGETCVAHECQPGFNMENNMCVEHSSSEMDAGVIAGIVIGCVVGVLLIGAAVYYFTKQKGERLNGPDDEGGWANRQRTRFGNSAGEA
eukprot:TRINITY_DN23447_c1_g1_i2.p1 TRINITY_DN23447_c1_g1~~TRINITY_DN23447_c1_g1_i2.p1  ORF type:complete len:381 (+),score=69.30 TRINITY_DN23447_c1_g1_i2:46-1188(+)